ncbi:hypothetical protein QTP88_025787 [Uroleucon formosanum]
MCLLLLTILINNICKFVTKVKNEDIPPSSIEENGTEHTQHNYLICQNYNSEDIEPEQFVRDLCDSHESSTISKATESTNLTDQVKKSQLFVVIIDTTTDISNQEQFSLVLRYVNYDGNIEERLAALETATDGTGMGLFHAFKNITEKYGINWREDLCAQSYDGAASMQGEYSG